MTGADVVRWGVLGCADIARRRVLPALATIPDTRLVAVASRDRGRAERFVAGTGAEPIAGYESLLRRPDVDAVYLPLPPALHAGWVEAALAHGKHVLCEKPLTTDPEQSRTLLAAARDRGLVLRENFMFVHHPAHDRVRALLADGAIGELRSFAASFAIPRRPDGDIRLRPDLGGGALLDVGGYPLRAAQLFLGPGLRVAGAALTPGDTGVDVGGAALLRRDDGVAAQLTFGLDHQYTSGYELTGSAGRMRCSHVFTPPATHEPVLPRLQVQHREEIRLPAADQVRAALVAFLADVAAGAGTDGSIEIQAELVAQTRSVAQP